MQINEIIKRLEQFAPPETQEDWDNSGWQIFYGDKPVNKILLCLSLTEDILHQAQDKSCDLIISHHPFLFPHAVPLEFNRKIPIYSAHTNLDKARGGTTDSLIEFLDLRGASVDLSNISFTEKEQEAVKFLRLTELEKPMSLLDFALLLKIKLNLFNLRIINNLNKQEVKKIAFCAGSGAEFFGCTEKFGADILVTGDVKYHTALDSNVIIADVGHFESEQPVLFKLKELLAPIEVIIADEKSPFINY